MIWTPSAIRRRARRITDSLRAAGCRRVIAVNFGVGTNPRKRLTDDFESRLLREILEAPRTVVLLDRGFGREELSRTAALLSSLRDTGLTASNACFKDSQCPRIAHGIVGVECAIGEVAALIAECDEFIGYDSACQHIAAAARVPTLTIFAGSNNMNFIRRWSACGDTRCRIVHVNTLADPGHIDTDAVMLRIMEERAVEAPARAKRKRRILGIKGAERAGEQAERAVDGHLAQ
jgi:ADP-heptose:LPS heptosyltransferase